MAIIDQSVWDRAKELLRSRVNPQSYETWFSPIKLVDISDTGVLLEVPNKFFQSWVSEKYLKQIEETIEALADAKLSVSLTLPAQGSLEPAAGVRVMPKAAETGSRHSGLNLKYTFDDFVVGPSNRFAHAASLAVSDSPAKAYNPLFIYGGVGLGKTHLMQAIGNKAVSADEKLKVLYISSEQFTNQLISAIQNRTTIKFRQLYRCVDILLIDDIHFISGKEATQEEFFHTFNALHDAHKQIVLSSDRSPKDIVGLEERLISRFEWGLVTDIQPPDLETRTAILKKKAERETQAVPNDVAFFIAEKIKSNIRELEGALVRVLAYAKLMGKDISLPLVKEVLKDMALEDEIKVTVELIQKKVADHFHVRLVDMKGKKRNRGIVYPRQIAMYLARDLTDYSLPEIGSFFGGRDHTTVMHACEKIGQELRRSKKTKELVGHLIGAVRA